MFSLIHSSFFPLFPFVFLRSPQYRGTLPPQRVPVRRDRSLHPHEQTVQRRSGLHRRLGRGAALPRYRRSRSTLPETFRKPHSQADETIRRIGFKAMRAEKIFLILKLRFGKQFLMRLKNVWRDCADHVDRSGRAARNRVLT